MNQGDEDDFRAFVVGRSAALLNFAHLLTGDRLEHENSFWRRYLAGAPTFRHGFGWLTRNLDGGLVAVVLVVAGVAIGYGAKTAGGCTSGNGLGGCATGSRASLTATGTFMATAIAVSFAIKAFT